MLRFHRVYAKKSRGMILQSCMGALAALTSSGVLMQCGGCPLFPIANPLSVNAGPDLSLALNESDEVTATTSNVRGSITYQWEIISGTALIGDDDDATVIVGCGSIAGTTILRVSATDGTCLDTDEVRITCGEVTPGDLEVDAGADQTAVQGETVVLTAAVTGGEAPISFSWLLTGSGITGTATLVNANTQTPSVTFSAGALGTFTFSVTATDNNADTDTDTVSVTVGLAPVIPVSAAFTLDIDDLQGSASNDTFTAPLLFTLGFGQLPTLQTGDAADGLAGTDTLNAFINDAAGSTIIPTLSGIETQNYNAQDAMIINATNITGAVTINTVNSSGNLTVNGLNNVVAAGILNTSNNLTLNFTASAIAGIADALTLSVNGANSTFTSNGIETLGIISTGGDDNILTLVLGSNLTLINVSGAANLDLGNLAVNNANVATINAATFTGDLIIGGAASAVTISGGSGDDDLTGSSSDDTINGGAGADTINGADGADDLAGGVGPDTYVMAATADIDEISMEAGDVNGTPIDDIFDFATNFDLFGAAPSVVVVSDADITAGADSGVTAGDNIIILTGDFFVDADALAAATTELTTGPGDVVIIYSSAAGDTARMAIATVDALGDITAAEDLAVLIGLNVAEAATGFADANFTSD